jgi:radical SAM protein with 4Fe4S-binding SPASM domain
MHSTRGVPDGVLAQTGIPLKHMDIDLFDKIVHDIMEFPEQPKRITFSGLGEPLMNPRLGEMARRLRQAGYTGRNDIITNGVTITPSLADELAESGINRIQISVQGLTREANERIAGVPVDVEYYLENLTYLFEHKKSMEIFIKIIDANLNDKAEEEQFYKMFSSVCDTIFVEHLIIMERQMGDHNGRVNPLLNFNCEPFEPREVCGVMFYILQITIDGNIYPCPTPGLPGNFSLGNVKEKSLRMIWNGSRRTQLLRVNLKNGYSTFQPCRECSGVVCITDQAEWLDDCRDEILARLPE